MSTEPPPVVPTPTPTVEAASSDAKPSDDGVSSSTDTNESVTKPISNIPPPENQGEGTEIVEVEAESIRPPPPRSLRPKSAKDSTTQPLAVTAKLPAPVWPPKTVADLMTRKIITVDESESIGKLEEWMQRFHFRHLPVVDASRKLVGLISRTDLLHAELGRKPDGTTVDKADATTLAVAIMRRGVVVAHLDSTLAIAGTVMLDNRLTCLPVVLDDGTLVGILTQTDFVRCTRDLMKGKPSQN